ncbi:MAG: hypothetical protein RSE41_03375 [Clostridia bacterium]
MINIEKFNSLISNEKSKWHEKAKWRRDNHYWLLKTKKLSIFLLGKYDKEFLYETLKILYDKEIINMILIGDYKLSDKEILHIKNLCNEKSRII